MHFPPPGERRRWALGGAAILALLIAAGALLTRTGGKELSRAEFVAQGDQLCVQANDDFEELQAEPPRTAREAAALTERLVDIAADELDAIDDLSQPSELEEEIDRYLEIREEGLELLREGRDAAEAGEARRYEAAQAELAAGQGQRRRLARQIGFRECSRPLTRP